MHTSNYDLSEKETVGDQIDAVLQRECRAAKANYNLSVREELTNCFRSTVSQAVAVSQRQLPLRLLALISASDFQLA